MSEQTEMRHTPGPWKYQNDTDMIVSVHPEWNWSCIAKLATGEDSRQEDANAKLIAAAPDLLQACRCALQQLIGSKALSGVHASSLRADMRIVQEAISKATGEQFPTGRVP